MRAMRCVARAWGIGRAAMVVGVVVGHLVFASDGWAVRARVTFSDGDRVTGEWLGSDGTQFRLGLDSGEELQLPLDGFVEFQTDGGHFVSADAVQRLYAALDARELGLEDLELEALRDAAALAPKYARAHWELGQYLERHEMSGAFDHYVIAAQLDPTAFPIEEKYQRAAEEALAEGNYLGAARALITFAQSFPGDPYASQAAYDAGDYYWDSLDENATSALYDQAIDALEFATGMFPAHPDVAEGLYRLGTMYEKLKQPDRAISALSRLLLDHPDSVHELNAHLVRGYAYLQRGDAGRVREEALWVLGAATDEAMRERAYALATDTAWDVLTPDDGLAHQRVLALCRDGGTLWVGTAKGLVAIDATVSPPTVSLAVPPIVEPTLIRAIAANEQELWIGTSFLGLFRYDKVTGQVSTYAMLPGLPDKNVAAIAMDERAVWAGGVGGLARFDRITGVWESYPHDPYTPGAYEGGTVTSLALTTQLAWVGTQESGVYTYDRVTGLWQAYTTRDGLGSNRVTSMVVVDGRPILAWYTEDQTGYSEWVGTARPWTREPLGPDTIAPEDIRIGYAAGSVWLATGAGLLERTTDRSWHDVAYPAALDGAHVETMLPDGDYVWIGTDQGLGRLDLSVLQPAGPE